MVQPENHVEDEGADAYPPQPRVSDEQRQAVQDRLTGWPCLPARAGARP